MSDRALWITWYSLHPEGRNAYLAWLHGSYIPALLTRPGYLWAAHYATMARDSLMHAGHATTDAQVPAGTQFILLVGAARAEVFGAPTPDTLHASSTEAAQKMLALRSGERTSIMAETARVDGKALAGYQSGMLPAPCIQLGSFNYPWKHEQELHAWFTQWRMPALQPMPGCVRIRKLAAVAGWARHGALYEWTSLEARNRDYPTHEDKHPKMQAWSEQVITRIEHAPPGSGVLATRIWPLVRADSGH